MDLLKVRGHQVPGQQQAQDVCGQCELWLLHVPADCPVICIS